jgi:hypothetical protein
VRRKMKKVLGMAMEVWKMMGKIIGTIWRMQMKICNKKL